MTHKMYFTISQICNPHVFYYYYFNFVRKLFREKYSIHIKSFAYNVKLFIADVFEIIYAQPFYVRCICTVKIYSI